MMDMHPAGHLIVADVPHEYVGRSTLARSTARHEAGSLWSGLGLRVPVRGRDAIQAHAGLRRRISATQALIMSSDHLLNP